MYGVLLSFLFLSEFVSFFFFLFMGKGKEKKVTIVRFFLRIVIGRLHRRVVVIDADSTRLVKK